jgi:acetyltransferase-like isoleucine patch superfamily enzyme
MKAAEIKQHTLYDPIILIVSRIPTLLGTLVRSLTYKLLCKKSSLSVMIGDLTRITYPERVSLGKHLTFNYLSTIDGRGGVTIGNYVMIGQKTTILTTNHGFSETMKYMKSQEVTTKPVIIQDDVWIGAGSIILPGVTLHSGCVVGAGSVVTKDVENDVIVAGVPAKLIRKR